MLVAALDEGGRFESLRWNYRNCMFIGGLTWECPDGTDADRKVNAELRRLESFFQTVCEEQNAGYPADLHPKRNAAGKIINETSMAKVKDALIREMPDFLQGKGRWERTGSQGTYRLYVMAGDARGIDDSEAGLGNLAADSVAGNRYERMVYRTVENLLKYNPRLKQHANVRLDLATRVIDVSKDEVLRAQTGTLGLAKRKDSNGGWDDTKRIVTDEASFRARLSSLVDDTDWKRSEFNLNVCSINYNKAYQWQCFLYLADTLCSLYQNALVGCENADQALKALYRCCADTAGENNFYLWAYRDIDRRYRKLCDVCRMKNHFHTLRQIGEERQKNGECAEIYDKLWYTELEKKVQAETTESTLRQALLALDSYLHSRNYSLQIADYILRQMQLQLTQLKGCKNREELQFQLYKCEMIVANHRGAYDQALAIYEQCISAASYVSIEEYIGMQNLLSVAWLDAGEIQKATEIAQSAVRHHNLLANVKKEIFTESSDVIGVSWGRTISQLGQCYAFSGQYDLAVEQFELALEKLGKNQSERRRTLSYLLHTLIEKGDRERYRRYAKMYFNDPGEANQWSIISKRMDSQQTDQSYMMYVFIKALYTFGRDTVSENILKGIIADVESIYQQRRGEHPWEMILKYCALLWLYRFPKADHFKAEKLMRLSEEAIGVAPTGILSQIAAANRAQFADAKRGIFEQKDSKLRYMYR